jgi:HD-like signal output (HDOD) protein
MTNALLISGILIGLVVMVALLWVLFLRETNIQNKPTVLHKPPPTPAQAKAAPAQLPTFAASRVEAKEFDALEEVHALALNEPRVADNTVKSDLAHMPVLMAANGAIAQIGQEPQYTPRCPSLLPQLLEAVSDEEASLRTMARIISQDPALTSSLLRTANSALYRVSDIPIESIERASALIGTQGIRSIITSSLIQPLTSGDHSLGQFGAVMWEHSLYSATAAETFAAQTQDCDPFTAHLLGLVHGLGSIAVFRVLVDKYAELPSLKPDGVAISEALYTSASVTAKRIAANWGLSQRTQEALEAQSEEAPVNDPSALSRALQFGRLAGAAILLCRHQRLKASAGHTVLESSGFSGPQVDRIWDRLVLAYVTP